MRTYLWLVFLSTSGRVSEIYVDFREGLEIHLHALSVTWLSDLLAFRFFSLFGILTGKIVHLLMTIRKSAYRCSLKHDQAERLHTG